MKDVRSTNDGSHVRNNTVYTKKGTYEAKHETFKKA